MGFWNIFLKGVHVCPVLPFCFLVAPPLLSFSIGSLCWLRLYVIGWLRGWDGVRGGVGGVGLDGVWGPPGSLTWIGLFRNRLPTVVAARWSDAPSPCIHVCIDVWSAPKRWQSYSWRNHTSMSPIIVSINTKKRESLMLKS